MSKVKVTVRLHYYGQISTLGAFSNLSPECMNIFLRNLTHLLISEST